jgi:hypothetical protein
MKNYIINSPSLDGIISDDLLYFEGFRRPNTIFTVRDGAIPTADDIDLLEKYFNDIYNLFLRKLSAFAMFENTDEEETMKMQALLQELIKVKKMMVNLAVDDSCGLV